MKKILSTVYLIEWIIAVVSQKKEEEEEEKVEGNIRDFIFS